MPLCVFTLLPILTYAVNRCRTFCLAKYFPLDGALQLGNRPKINGISYQLFVSETTIVQRLGHGVFHWLRRTIFVFSIMYMLVGVQSSCSEKVRAKTGAPRSQQASITERFHSQLSIFHS